MSNTELLPLHANVDLLGDAAVMKMSANVLRTLILALPFEWHVWCALGVVSLLAALILASYIY